MNIEQIKRKLYNIDIAIAQLGNDFQNMKNRIESLETCFGNLEAKFHRDRLDQWQYWKDLQNKIKEIENGKESS